MGVAVSLWNQQIPQRNPRVPRFISACFLDSSFGPPGFETAHYSTSVNDYPCINHINHIFFPGCFLIFFWTRMAIWLILCPGRPKHRQLRRRFPGGSKVIGRCRNESRSWRRTIWVCGVFFWEARRILFGWKEYPLVICKIAMVNGHV